MINVEVMKNFLEYYKYNPTTEGVQAIYDTWLRNKGALLDAFRKHPNWDEENLAIVLKEEEYERPFEVQALINFKNWSWRIIDNKIKEGFYAYEIECKLDNIDDIINYETRIRRCVQTIKSYDKSFDYLPNTGIIELKDEARKIRNYLSENKEGKSCITTNGGYDYYVDTDFANNVKLFRRSMDYICDYCNSKTLDEEQASRLSSKSGLEINVGLKLTKAIQKICKLVELDKYVELRHRNNNPENEMKDYGFNYEYALLTNAISPAKYKRITVISLNPLDYWGMSFGYKWASCHTIDKYHVRPNNDPSHHYEGCYSAGTESYMLDSSSIVFYVVREDYAGNVYWEEDKMNRVMFYINEDRDIMIESRVYPDGRDGGDNSLAKQFREVMQNVISQIFDMNNYWKILRGTSECRQYSESRGSHYRDYESYSDCNVSINKDRVNKLESNQYDYKKIKIGHEAICPVCGEIHDSENNIVCDDCLEINNNSKRCERCGTRFDFDNDGYYINGEYYCCYDCAREAGYAECYDDGEWYDENELYYCEDDNEWHNEEHSYTDSYDGLYYSEDPNIETDDGNYYYNEDHARLDGYEREYFTGDWINSNELEYDSYYEEWFDKERAEVETEEGNYFINEESFYSSYPNGILTDDGKYYESEDNAINDGYELDENSNWVKKDEVA